MKKYLYQILSETTSLTLEQITIQILAALVIGLIIYISYYISHSGTIYSKKFNVSLVMLTILTSMVMTVIGNNVALSLGMVGALSIVRFRTAIKDSRDTTYIFWAIIVGICCGVGDFLVAGIGSAIVFITMLILGRIKNDNRVLLIIRGTRNLERDIERIVFKQFNKKATMKVKNTSDNNIELIYELTKKMFENDGKQNKNITDKLYDLKGIEYVNMVVQNDEISG